MARDRADRTARANVGLRATIDTESFTMDCSMQMKPSPQWDHEFSECRHISTQPSDDLEFIDR